MKTTTKTRSSAAIAAAVMMAAGIGLSGVALTAAPVAIAAPKSCTQQHRDAGYTAAEARAECAGDDSRRGVIKVKPGNVPTTSTTTPSWQPQAPKHWWDKNPIFPYLLWGGGILAALWIGAYLYARRAVNAHRKGQTAEFAAGGGYETAADYPAEAAEPYIPPAPPAYHVPAAADPQQVPPAADPAGVPPAYAADVPPPAYAEQPDPQQQRPQQPPAGSGSSSAAFDELI